ncbi:hypothetical protein [Proteus mirabilis]|nr:hypothetical protein [Proteus mirabilis]MBB6725661.1 hypothetical protein [Proteus mirabilis]
MSVRQMPGAFQNCAACVVDFVQFPGIVPGCLHLFKVGFVQHLTDM